MAIARRAAIVTVLHGDPEVPSWLTEAAADPSWWLCLVVNDPAPGTYACLPAAELTLWNDRQRGFAANVNSACRFLPRGCEWVLFCNFDLRLDLAALQRLVQSGEACGAHVAAPTLQGADGQPTFSVGPYPRWQSELLRASIGETWLHHVLRNGLVRTRRSYQSRHAAGGSTHARLPQSQYLPWTCLAVRREALDKVGGLDERFPLYAEDVDWGFRAAAAGLTRVLVRLPDIRHAGRATRSMFADTCYEISNIRLHRKYRRWGPLLAQFCGLCIRLCLRPWRLSRPLYWGRIIKSLRTDRHVRHLS